MTMLLRCAVLAALLCAVGCDQPASSGSASTGSNTDGQPSGASPASNRSNVANNPEWWPPIEFEPPMLDLGVVAPGDQIAGSTRIHNVGDEPLRITGFRTSCGCTTIDDLTGRVIEPGGFAEFGTEIKPKSGLGPKNEGLRIAFDGYTTAEQPPVEYKYAYEVSLTVRAQPPYLNAVEALTGEVVVTARDGAPFKVLSAGGVPMRTPPLREHTLAWDLTAADAAGEVPWFWVVETDHPSAPVVDLRVRHDSTKPERPRSRPWGPQDHRVLIGERRVGDTVTVETSIKFNEGIPPADYGVTVTSASPYLTPKLTGIRVDGVYLYYDIELTIGETEPGVLYGLIHVHNNGFNAPLRVIGRVAE